MSQSVLNIFKDYGKILFHIKLFDLKFSGKTSEVKYAASPGTKAKQFFFILSAIT